MRQLSIQVTMFKKLTVIGQSTAFNTYRALAHTEVNYKSILLEILYTKLHRQCHLDFVISCPAYDRKGHYVLYGLYICPSLSIHLLIVHSFHIRYKFFD